MADYVFIWGAANDNEWIFDIQGSSPAAGAPLDNFPQKPDCNDNQQWEVVQSTVLNPSGSGDTYYYFIKSKLNSKNVITANGASVEMAAQKSPDSKDQLWEFNSSSEAYSSDGLSYFAIQSAKDGHAISIPEATKKSKVLLQMSPLNNSLYQLWIFQGGLGAPGVQNTP
jgi:hypothetical protein